MTNLLATRATRWNGLERLSIAVNDTRQEAIRRGEFSFSLALATLEAQLDQQALDVDEQIEDGLCSDHAHTHGLLETVRALAPAPPAQPRPMSLGLYLCYCVVGCLAALGLVDLVRHTLG